MRLFKFLILLPAFIIFILHSASAQTDDVLNNIINKTSKAHNDVPVEKVYLHFDKPYYAVGDTIWFKAYLTYDLHQPSPLSKVVYVDLISAADSLVSEAKLPVKNGVAW